MYRFGFTSRTRQIPQKCGSKSRGNLDEILGGKRMSNELFVVRLIVSPQSDLSYFESIQGIPCFLFFILSGTFLYNVRQLRQFFSECLGRAQILYIDADGWFCLTALETGFIDSIPLLQQFGVKYNDVGSVEWALMLRLS